MDLFLTVHEDLFVTVNEEDHSTTFLVLFLKVTVQTATRRPLQCQRRRRRAIFRITVEGFNFLHCAMRTFSGIVWQDLNFNSARR
jgi:hypothetical protein